MTKPCTPSLFQDKVDVLFCCLVESVVGDGLRPVHFQSLVLGRLHVHVTIRCVTTEDKQSSNRSS